MRGTFWIKVAVIIIGNLTAIGYLAMTVNVGRPCARVISERYLSPDKKKIAFVVSDNCGPAGEYRTSIQIRNADDTSDLGSEDVFSIKGLKNIDVDWK